MEFINLKKQYQMLKSDIDNRIAKVLADGHYIGGEEIEELETRLAAYTGRKHCITCGSGTAALQLIYMAYDIGFGDAVFCPDMTFIASIEPACMLGASPVFCDIESDTYNIDPISLENEIARIERQGELAPRAVVAVDFLGNPAKYDDIQRICSEHGLILIEDAAQSMGAAYHGAKCCSFGDAAATSFFPSKPLGCFGDGGAVFVDDDDTAELLRSLKVHGRGPKGKYDNIRVGINSRLDTIQAAVLLAKLDSLDYEIEMRQELAAKYNAAFQDYVGIPIIEEGVISSYAQYCITLESLGQRKKMADDLTAKLIPSLVYYPNPLHTLKAFSPYPDGEYPNASRYAECNLGLPFSPYLSRSEQDLVIAAVKESLANL